ncbi:hypothetical protein LIER_00300 [Lithospermum erythrorhizon]|uniref:Uncharacterized protein n=1 Tax=Lithospermum erythrorhizon TaxID=34254 RepID=A0AAV3NI12_LITER
MASSSSTCSDDIERLQMLKQYLQKKMVANSLDLPLKPIRTKPEKLSLEALSRDFSVNSTSSEYYADSPVAVPFRWESQPGTPKLRYRESLIPPLTPPPSYTLSPARKHVKKQPKTTSLLQNVLPRRLNFAKNHQTSTPTPLFEPHPLSYTLSPTSYSVPSSPYNATPQAQSQQSSFTSSSESRADSDDYESPSSIFCLNIGR